MLGSLVVILLVFLLTAILVKVDIAPLPFFSITMICIVGINCEFQNIELTDISVSTIELDCIICIAFRSLPFESHVNLITFPYLLVSGQPLQLVCWENALSQTTMNPLFNLTVCLFRITD